MAQTYHWRKWVVAEKDAFLAQTDISPISESTFALHRHILFILFICNYTFWVKIANTMNIKHLKLKYIWKSEQNPKRRRDPYLDTNQIFFIKAKIRFKSGVLRRCCIFSSVLHLSHRNRLDSMSYLNLLAVSPRKTHSSKLTCHSIIIYLDDMKTWCEIGENEMLTILDTTDIYCWIE